MSWVGLKPLRAVSMGPLYSAFNDRSSLHRFMGGVLLMGLVILNFWGVLMSLKSIFSGVSGMRSVSSRRRLRGVERRVTPNL